MKPHDNLVSPFLITYKLWSNFFQAVFEWILQGPVSHWLEGCSFCYHLCYFWHISLSVCLLFHHGVCLSFFHVNQISSQDRCPYNQVFTSPLHLTYPSNMHNTTCFPIVPPCISFQLFLKLPYRSKRLHKDIKQIWTIY